MDVTEGSRTFLLSQTTWRAYNKNMSKTQSISPKMFLEFVLFSEFSTNSLIAIEGSHDHEPSTCTVPHARPNFSNCP
ncbi:unnamed protein product [Chondrus crispus]|uniref:Uncharacterized protein n=1 Tax=Chondrus crispus TaxID=2769 RepID=R7QQQ0_CHOCR|nr:unnamed protein product [Chondrus crispus]CDF40449.1 unnamed protein product [Chondrus crispus]|eukprot:XP_005710743.1 unnamed protein product [Chondrus crispus]